MRVSDSSTFAAVGIALLTSLKSRSDSDHQKDQEGNSGTGMQVDKRETVQETQASVVRESRTELRFTLCLDDNRAADESCSSESRNSFACTSSSSSEHEEIMPWSDQRTTTVEMSSESITFSRLNSQIKSKKVGSNDRLQRSRERNRIHARKTRQRKKEQMQGLQGQADNLKQEQMRLRQIINEKNTANILVGLFATSDQIDNKRKEDPAVEELLRRPVNEIPDSSKISELPALILPGHHASKKIQATNARDCALEVGIDYQLLGKDRSKCTPEELDQIRRERNRMHAKRTRDRKRMFMEEMAEMCRVLREENDMLRAHLAEIDPGHEDAVPKVTSEAAMDSPISSPVVSSPQLLPLAPKFELLEVSSNPSAQPTKKNSPSLDQIQALLDAAIKSERASVKRTQDGDRFYSIEDESCKESCGFSCPMTAPCKRKRHSSSHSVGHRLDSTAAVGC